MPGSAGSNVIYVTRTILDTRVDEKMALLIKYESHSISNGVGEPEPYRLDGSRVLLMS
jgi:hypothetical protein